MSSVSVMGILLLWLLAGATYGGLAKKAEDFALDYCKGTVVLVGVGRADSPNCFKRLVVLTRLDAALSQPGIPA